MSAAACELIKLHLTHLAVGRDGFQSVSAEEGWGRGGPHPAQDFDYAFELFVEFFLLTLNRVAGKNSLTVS